MSFPPLLAIVGSALSSILLNFLGRKNSILLSGFFFSSSFLLIGLADFTPSRDELVLTGRAISGLGVGLGVPSTSIYIAETSSPQLRGKLSSLPALFLALGVLLGYFLGMDSQDTATSQQGNYIRNIPALGPAGPGLLRSWFPPNLDNFPPGVSLLPGWEGEGWPGC